MFDGTWERLFSISCFFDIEFLVIDSICTVVGIVQIKLRTGQRIFVRSFVSIPLTK